MKKFIFIILTALFLASCGTTSQASKAAQTTEESSPAISANASAAKGDKTLYKGAGIAIAVTSPQIRNASQNIAWIPQFFQDSLTGNLAKYSKMTVLDRANESLIKAEQELSESGFYTEENAAQIGQMTNAQLVVAGSIQQIGGAYELNFRVNDVSTNEIKASANDRYSLSEIENGKAIGEVTQNLLEGLGIELSEKEKLALSKSNPTELKSTQNLAKGAAAEKSGDYVGALAFYAETGGIQRTEAAKNSQAMLDGTIPTGSIKEKAAFYEAQKTKWNKTFADLKSYIERELPIFVYDFSDVKDEINMQKRTVNITVSRGVAFVMRRTAFIVYKEVWEAWKELEHTEENKVWMAAVKTQYFGSVNSEHYGIDIALLDDDGNIIKTVRKTREPMLIIDGPYAMKVKSQQKYFEDAVFLPVKFESIELSELPENFHVKVTRVFSYSASEHKKLFGKELEYPIVPADEWAAFAAGAK